MHSEEVPPDQGSPGQSTAPWLRMLVPSLVSSDGETDDLTPVSKAKLSGYHVALTSNKPFGRFFRR